MRSSLTLGTLLNAAFLNDLVVLDASHVQLGRIRNQRLEDQCRAFTLSVKLPRSLAVTHLVGRLRQNSWKRTIGTG